MKAFGTVLAWIIASGVAAIVILLIVWLIEVLVRLVF